MITFCSQKFFQIMTWHLMGTQCLVMASRYFVEGTIGYPYLMATSLFNKQPCVTIETYNHQKFCVILNIFFCK